MIGGALYQQLGLANGSDTDAANRSYTLEELAQCDGKAGNECLVAVDGGVYLIEGFTLWQMGKPYLRGAGSVAASTLPRL